eukprot:GCRY01002229.1.p1 GENE.GCRY01002229.1~~GCRY01002229.1.p1  ORF type:complete len:439 (+),score=85.57 GCRY01002229.1:80-1396(+)
MKRLKTADDVHIKTKDYEMSRSKSSILDYFRRKKSSASSPSAQTAARPSVETSASLSERYEACFFLAALGDALGFRNTQWEFCYDTSKIHNEFEGLLERCGGFEKFTITPKWRVSDDTVMHLATARAVLKDLKSSSTKKPKKEEAHSEEEEEEENEEDDATEDRIFAHIVREYIDCFGDMEGRSPGPRTFSSVMFLEKKPSRWNTLPYCPAGGGCGGSMRSMCIGLGYPHSVDRVIAVAIEAGRITHNHSTGYLGSLVSALFTHFAINSIPPADWGCRFLALRPQITAYVEKVGRDVDKYNEDCSYFYGHFERYLKSRGITSPGQRPVFPRPYGVEQRDDFYAELSFDGWGGASGHDSVLIAYDALLGCAGEWRSLVLAAVLHGGDNDSTGTIAAAWFGAYYGFKGVPKCHYADVEKSDEIRSLTQSFYELAQNTSSK